MVPSYIVMIWSSVFAVCMEWKKLYWYSMILVTAWNVWSEICMKLKSSWHDGVLFSSSTFITSSPIYGPCQKFWKYPTTKLFRSPFPTRKIFLQGIFEILKCQSQNSDHNFYSKTPFPVQPPPTVYTKDFVLGHFGNFWYGALIKTFYFGKIHLLALYFAGKHRKVREKLWRKNRIHSNCEWK